MYKTRDQPKMVVKVSDEKIADITSNLAKLYIEYAFIQELTGFSKKRLDLWLFRHKNDIEVLKHEKQKFISLNILVFLPKMVKNSKRGR